MPDRNRRLASHGPVGRVPGTGATAHRPRAANTRPHHHPQEWRPPRRVVVRAGGRARPGGRLSGDVGRAPAAGCGNGGRVVPRGAGRPIAAVCRRPECSGRAGHRTGPGRRGNRRGPGRRHPRRHHPNPSPVRQRARQLPARQGDGRARPDATATPPATPTLANPITCRSIKNDEGPAAVRGPRHDPRTAAVTAWWPTGEVPGSVAGHSV